MLFIPTSTATVILEHPKDVEAVPNEWVQFNCTVTDCNTYHVRWYIAGRSHPLNDNINSVPGLVFRRSSSICTSSTQRTHFIEVQANQAFDKSAFYCGVLERSQEAASQCRCTSRWCYSTPALLIGKPVRNMFCCSSSSFICFYCWQMSKILLDIHLR